DRLWIAHRGGAGLVVFKPESASSFAGSDKLITRKLAGFRPSARPNNQQVKLPAAPGEVFRFTTADGLAGDRILKTFQSADGRIWIDTSRGLTEFRNGRFQINTAARDLSSSWLAPQTEDRNGNLWLASPTGAVKITWSGFTTFGKPDGLGKLNVNSIFENQRGELYAINGEGKPFINRLDGQRFISVAPHLPSETKSFGWGSNQITFQDHTGEWWVPTGSGLLRFPRVANVEQLAHTPPKNSYNHQRGDLPGDDIFRLFEDSRGDVWVSIAGNLPIAVVRWERATETFQAYSEADGLPSFSLPTAYCEDAHGSLWMGFYD